MGTVGAAALLVVAACSEFIRCIRDKATKLDGSWLGALGDEASGTLLSSLRSASGLGAGEDVDAEACGSRGSSRRAAGAEEDSAADMAVWKRTRSRGA